MHCKTRETWPSSGLFFDFWVIVTSGGYLLKSLKRLVILSFQGHFLASRGCTPAGNDCEINLGTLFYVIDLRFSATKKPKQLSTLTARTPLIKGVEVHLLN